jgi:hypothetical protein
VREISISGFGVRVPDCALFSQVRGHPTADLIKIIPIFAPFYLWSGAAGLKRAIREIFDRHGLTWGRSHIGRKHQVNDLIGEGCPLTEITKILGWNDVMTVKKYADTAAAISDDTRAAMARSAGS